MILVEEDVVWKCEEKKESREELTGLIYVWGDTFIVMGCAKEP